MSHIRNFLGSIKVKDCGLSKIRVGNEHDGGYVVYRELAEKSPVLYSAGVGNDVGFELDWVNRWPKSKIKLYDPYVKELPTEHNRFSLYKVGLGLHYKPLADIVQDATFKLDIEWDEWGAIEVMKDEDLRKFSQIVGEFHLVHAQPRSDLSPYFYSFYLQVFDKLNEDLFYMYHMVLQRLHNWFHIFHIHANNSLPMVSVDGFTLPPLLELSFVRKDLVKKNPSASREQFPVKGLDLPNKTNRMDILDYYPFRGAPSPWDEEPSSKRYRKAIQKIVNRGANHAE